MTARLDMWGDWPGDLCRTLYKYAWTHPSECQLDSTNHTINGTVVLEYDQLALIIATTQEFQPKKGSNWTWCLLLTIGPTLCWIPSSWLRRIT